MALRVAPNESQTRIVLFVIDGFFPLKAGLEKQAQTMGEYLAAQGVAIEYWAPRLDGDKPLKESVNGIPLTRISYPRIKGIGAVILVMKYIAMLLANRYRLRAIHIHTTRNLAAATGIIRHWLGVPVISKVSGYAEFKGGLLDPDRANKPLYRVMNALIHRLDYFQTISRGTEDYLVEAGYPREKLRFIPNGVDLAVYGRMTRRATGSVVVGYLGRLVAVKGVDVLVNAFVRAAGAEPRLELLIAGAGDMQAQLQNLIDEANLSDRARFLGAVDDVPGFFSNVDIYVQPSYQEGLPNSVLEAMASGLPVVATDVTGNQDLVTGGETGLLVEAGDTVAISEALIRLAGDTDLRAQLGRGGLAFVRQRYDIQAVAAELMTLYRVVDGKR